MAPVFDQCLTSVALLVAQAAWADQPRRRAFVELFPAASPRSLPYFVFISRVYLSSSPVSQVFTVFFLPLPCENCLLSRRVCDH